MRDCGFKHSYGKLLTVAPCRSLCIQKSTDSFAYVNLLRLSSCVRFCLRLY
ncbi:hypothetical protein HMPREF9554_02143 [Treponema phagedenis F0421]|nr:hypothetical protein HMPREF9554_02143 [Treponema phagedenis F0421]